MKRTQVTQVAKFPSAIQMTKGSNIHQLPKQPKFSCTQVLLKCPSALQLPKFLSVIVPKWPSALSAQVVKCSSASSTQVSKCIKCPSSELPQVPSSSQVSEYLTGLSAQVPFNSPQVIQSPSSILSAKTPYISKYHSLIQLFLVFQVP